jgi:hypothetical protein
MLTLLKQARAFGLGCVLATQNPVDLDYKGLSNAGTWFLGRLQTERDKARVLEGLEGAAAQVGQSFDRGEMEEVLAGLGSRKFLMNNVHEDQPVVFETRWAMSYLRGPLTSQQLKKLMDDDPAYDAAAVAQASEPKRPAAEKAESMEPQIDARQLIPSDVEQWFAEVRRSVSDGQRLVYRPSLLGRGRLHYVKSTYKVDQWEERSLLASVGDDQMPNEVWEQAEVLDERLALDSEPESGAAMATLPGDLQKAKNYKTWEKALKEFLYRRQPLTIWKCVELKQYSEPGEELGDFKVRLGHLASEERDEAIEKLRKKFASKLKTAQTRVRRAEDKVEVQEAQYQQSRMNSVLSVGTTLVGALFGRKTFGATNARRAGTSVRSFGRASKEKDDIARAQEELQEKEIAFEELEQELSDQIDELTYSHSLDAMEFEELEVTPRKSDISVERFCVCWLPWRVDANGIAEPAW